MRNAEQLTEVLQTLHGQEDFSTEQTLWELVAALLSGGWNFELRTEDNILELVVFGWYKLTYVRGYNRLKITYELEQQ